MGINSLQSKNRDCNQSNLVITLKKACHKHGDQQAWGDYTSLRGPSPHEGAWGYSGRLPWHGEAVPSKVSGRVITDGVGQPGQVTMPVLRDSTLFMVCCVNEYFGYRPRY